MRTKVLDSTDRRLKKLLSEVKSLRKLLGNPDFATRASTVVVGKKQLRLNEVETELRYLCINYLELLDSEGYFPDGLHRHNPRSQEHLSTTPRLL